MAKCPNCNQDVSIPFVMRLSGDSCRLTCEYCKAGLKWTKHHSSKIFAATLALLVFAMGPDTHSFAKVLVLIASAMLLVSLRESRNPELQMLE
jgi:hypothetical protein